jgi:hypothetical protein
MSGSGRRATIQKACETEINIGLQVGKSRAGKECECNQGTQQNTPVLHYPSSLFMCDQPQLTKCNTPERITFILVFVKPTAQGQ